MKYKLRPYQLEAVQAILDSVEHPAKDIVSLPVGSGKSLVIADFVNRLESETLILQPSREILSANRQKLSTYIPQEDIGIYSASFNSKDIKRYTFATIQSIYKIPDLFTHFKVILIDECDLYSNKKKSMYNKFLKANKAKIIGLTATPYRMEQKKKVIYPMMTVMSVLRMLDQESFDRIIFNINTNALTKMGYLTPLKYIDHTVTMANFELNSDKKIVEDFELRLTMGSDNLLAWRNTYEQLRGSTIVFCPTVQVARLLQRLTDSSALLTGETPKKERDQIFSDFQERKINVLFNVEVLTVGVDIPHLSNIVLLRPTKSIRLYQQILGRGTRLSEGKSHCNIYDLCGVTRHLGELEEIEVLRNEGVWNLKTRGGWQRNKIQSWYKTKL